MVPQPTSTRLPPYQILQTWPVDVLGVPAALAQPINSWPGVEGWSRVPTGSTVDGWNWVPSAASEGWSRVPTQETWNRAEDVLEYAEESEGLGLDERETRPRGKRGGPHVRRAKHQPTVC